MHVPLLFLQLTEFGLDTAEEESDTVLGVEDDAVFGRDTSDEAEEVVKVEGLIGFGLDTTEEIKAAEDFELIQGDF